MVLFTKWTSNQCESLAVVMFCDRNETISGKVSLWEKRMAEKWLQIQVWKVTTKWDQVVISWWQWDREERKGSFVIMLSERMSKESRPQSQLQLTSNDVSNYICCTIFFSASHSFNRRWCVFFSPIDQVICIKISIRIRRKGTPNIHRQIHSAM